MNEPTGSHTRADDAQRQQDLQPASFEDQNALFIALSSYSFDLDPEYINGLSTILGHPDVPPSSSEISQNADLVTQAKCFYFTRKHGLLPVDPAAYRHWLQSRSADPSTAHHASSQTSDLSTSTSAAEPSSISPDSSHTDERPPYPTSFAAIVDLITRNVPVPGIEEIPATVLEHGSSKVDNTPRRRKPWENEAEELSPPSQEPSAEAAEQTATSPPRANEDTINGHLSTGEGVVKILQPNAIPESGLLSKD